MKKVTLASIKKRHNISYLGGVKTSVKIRKSFEKGTNTYCLYLAPSDLSGYNVCPNSRHCRELCLNGCGRNLMDIIHEGDEKLSRINIARIRKTRMFFEDKESFMILLINEIKNAYSKALADGKEFSVRLNGTSDISPEDFVYNGKNILEIFPNIQFYDYTKVYGRMKLSQKYNNYDLTYSYNGYNWDICHKVLLNSGKVAVVFESRKQPKKWRGFDVVDANGYDMRYLDNGGQICGLTYHKVANNYVNSVYHKPNTKFVVWNDDKDIVW